MHEPEKTVRAGRLRAISGHDGAAPGVPARYLPRPPHPPSGGRHCILQVSQVPAV